MQTLEKCPFCGSLDLTLKRFPNICYVRCNKCLALGGMSTDPSRAIDKWNGRVSR